MTNVQLFILSSVKHWTTSQTRRREVRCVAPKSSRPWGQIYDSRWILEPFIVSILSNSISGASFLFVSQQFCDSVACKEVPYSHIMPHLLSSVFSCISLPYKNTNCLPANHQSSRVIVSLNDRILRRTRNMFMVKICVSVQDRGSDRHPHTSCVHCGLFVQTLWHTEEPEEPTKSSTAPFPLTTLCQNRCDYECVFVCVQLKGKSFIFTHE